MRPILAVFGDHLPTTAYLLCCVLATFAIIAVVRSCWLPVRDALVVSLIEAGMVATLVVVIGLVSAPRPAVTGVLRLVPGADLGIAVNGNPGELWPWLQLLGNFLLLFPLGALLPVRLRWFCRFRRVALFAVGTTCAIEFTQWAVFTGRVVSTDDVILNTSGAMLGAVLTRRRWNSLERRGAPWIIWNPAPRTAVRPRHLRAGGG